jgi:hypothetical protein
MMLSIEALRERLEAILKKTASADAFGGMAWYPDDKADSRRFQDDERSGRQDWWDARDDARRGLEALASRDANLATFYLLSAWDHYTTALEARMEPKDYEALSTGAGLRGRPKGAVDPERDRLIAEAVAEQHRLGRQGSQAIGFAKRANRELMKGMTIPAVREALRRGQKKT